MNSGDVLLQWQDADGAWQRGYAVETQDGIRGKEKPSWIFYMGGCEIMECDPKDILDPASTWPSADFPLLVMPLYSKRPVAVWVEIGKLTVVPDRTD